MQRLQPESTVDEVASEAVEQLGVRRRIAQTQIVEWFDDSRLEVLVPDSIDRGLREIGIGW